MRNRSEQGLTLVEIIFSIAVLSIGLTATIAVVTQGGAYNTIAQRQQIATQASQSRLEQTIAVGADDIYEDLPELDMYVGYALDSVPALSDTVTYDTGYIPTSLPYFVSWNIDPCSAGLWYHCAPTALDPDSNPAEFAEDGLLYGLPDYGGTSSMVASYPISQDPDMYIIISKVDYPYHYLVPNQSSTGGTGSASSMVKSVVKTTLQFAGGSGTILGNGTNLIDGGGTSGSTAIRTGIIHP